MDIKAFEYFIILAEEKNMRKAAERLFISQQGLSRIIINLEKELGCDLFERKRSGMVLTTAGERLFDSAKRIRVETVELRRDIDTIKLKRPVIRVACAYGTLHLLYPALTDFKDQYPDIEVQWEECIDDECERRLETQEADVAFNVFDQKKNDYIMQRLYQSRFAVLVKENDPLYDSDSVSIPDLRDRRLLSVGTGFHMFNVIRQKCLDYGFYPDIETGIKEIDLIHRLVLLGEGTGLSVEFIADMVRIPGVKAKYFTDEELLWEIVLERRADCRMTPSLQLFWDFITEKAKSM